jgi:prevent-host-death family protein
MFKVPASTARIPPEKLSRVIITNEVIEITHRSHPSAYIIGPKNWELLQQAMRQREAAVHESSQRIGKRHRDLMRRLAE